MDVELAFLDGVIAEVEPAGEPAEDDAGSPDDEGGGEAPTQATNPAAAPAPAAPTGEAGGCTLGRGERAPSGLAAGLVVALLLAARVSRARARS